MLQLRFKKFLIDLYITYNILSEFRLKVKIKLENGYQLSVIGYQLSIREIDSSLIAKVSMGYPIHGRILIKG